MKKIHFSTETDGFYGAYWKCREGRDAAIILMLGDDPEDHMAKSGVKWLHKLGIVGASTTGTLALTAASYFEDITLTIGITPSDFIWQGFMQGRRDGCKEWPIEGESLFSYQGMPLPYMPFVYKHPDYWRVIAAESKRTGEKQAS